MKKTPHKKKSSSIQKNSTYEVIELPSDNDEMEKYIEENRVDINKKMVDNIDYAINKRLGTVEVFCFKNSNFIVLMNRKDFKENLDNIFEFSLENEQFEVCVKIKKVIEKLDRLSYIYKYKKQK